MEKTESISTHIKRRFAQIKNVQKNSKERLGYK